MAIISPNNKPPVQDKQKPQLKQLSQTRRPGWPHCDTPLTSPATATSGSVCEGCNYFQLGNYNNWDRAKG